MTPIQIKELHALASSLVEELQGKCDHSLVEAHWEHDNGYGRQTRISGKRCVYCGWQDLWNRNVFQKP